MTCIRCGGRPVPGSTTLTLERAGTTLVLQAVPADVCPTCGEAYLSADTTDRTRELLDAAVALGARVAVQDYSETPHGEGAEEPSSRSARA